MWLTSVASTSVYKSCQSSCVSTILIIRACVWRRALCTNREIWYNSRTCHCWCCLISPGVARSLSWGSSENPFSNWECGWPPLPLQVCTKAVKVSTILIIHPTYYLLPVIDVYAASHSCQATIDQLKLISIIVILKCNRCGIYYGYSKYRNPSSWWNLYDSPRIAIEGSDVRFVQRRVTEIASLLGVCFSRLTVTDYFSIYAFQSLLVILLCDFFSCFKM